MSETDRIRVRTVDIESGEIKEYPSLMMCARDFNVWGSHVKYWIMHNTIRDGKRFEVIDCDDMNRAGRQNVATPKRACIVEDAEGNVVAEYSSIKSVAKDYGITQATMRYRIMTGKVYNGFVFKLANKNEKIQLSNPLTKSQRKSLKKTDTIVDRDKYRIIKYEMKYHICITPCPYMQYPKYMVGSGRCLSCSHFRGRDIETNEIACSKKFL